jgi:hypothetical protein
MCYDPKYVPKAFRQPNEFVNLKEKLSDAFHQSLQGDGRPFQFSRVCLVGEGRAGKTALANALCDRQFVLHTHSTIGVRSDSMEVTSFNVQALSTAWKVFSSDIFVGLEQQQLNWETAQRLAGLDRIGEGSIHDLYVDPQAAASESSPPPFCDIVRVCFQK